MNADSGAVLEHADMRGVGTAISGSNGACFVGELLQLDAPLSPTLSAQRQGQTVTLSWSDPGNATHFDVEVGSAPGLRNLLVASREGTTLTSTGVPPGRYYVRVRAINEIGRSVPSADLVVVVP